MITCGLKLTQSGGVALLEDDELLFNVEVQKVDNNPRYSYVRDLEFVPRVLADFGYTAEDVDHWVVDGWDGARTGTVPVRSGGVPLDITVAPYRETVEGSDLVQPLRVGQLPIDGRSRSFSSYVHTASHCAAGRARRGLRHRRRPAVGGAAGRRGGRLSSPAPD
jgi:carbamoyltransferase